VKDLFEPVIARKSPLRPKFPPIDEHSGASLLPRLEGQYNGLKVLEKRAAALDGVAHPACWGAP